MNIFSGRATRLVLVLLGLLCASLSITTAKATTIHYVATDLADVNPGEDLWRYDYTVSGRSFFQTEFFDILFTPTLYGMLTAGPAPNADWDAAAIQQPNPVNLPPFDTGIFDSFALSDSPSLSGAFSVSFIFLGSGVPGSQMFEIFDATPNLVETGFTSIESVPGAVPEPSTAVLLWIGLIVCAIHFRRKFAIRL